MRKAIIWFVIIVLLSGCAAALPDAEPPEVNSVYYEIFVASFYDSDGDGMGDLNGVYEKLDYIQNELGASAVWLMPIHPSPTYHKYDVVDYYGIDPDYGTMADFQRLADAMEKRGMDLIMDLVLNHTSAQHPWFQKAVAAWQTGMCDAVEECGYYHFSDRYQAGYHALNDTLYYEGVFWDQMPDLNLDHEAVRSEIGNIMQFWIDKGVSGFRLDATTHFYGEDTDRNTEFLSWLNQELKTMSKTAYLVGEAWTGSSIVSRMYASGVDSFFNFDVAQNSGSLITALNREDGAGLAQTVVEYNQTIKAANPEAQDAVFLSNHDNNRSAGYLGNDLMRQKLAASVYLLMPGNVFVYYGEEIGMKGSGKDENKRLPMRWDDEPADGATDPPIGSDYSAYTLSGVSTQQKDTASLWYHYRDVIAVRNAYPEIARGSMASWDLANPVLYAMVFDDTVAVIHNFSETSQEVVLDADSVQSLQGTAVLKDGILILEGLSSAVIALKT